MAALSACYGCRVRSKVITHEYVTLDTSVQSILPSNWTTDDTAFMRRALELAGEAETAGEVPVGAVVTLGARLLGEGRNRQVHSQDPSAHAEIEALRLASARLGNYRLAGATLYVTLEPCAMCAGALVLARVKRLVFGARDLRFGAVRSKFRLADSELLNHRAQVEEGLLASEAAEMLAAFFRQRRGDD